LFSLYSIIFSSRRRHTISKRDWSSDVCSSDLLLEHFLFERKDGYVYLVFHNFLLFVIKLGFQSFQKRNQIDRKSTRLNSSHVSISYAVFCLKKKTLTVSITFALAITATL